MICGRTGLPVCQGAKSWVASWRQNLGEQLDSFPVTVFLVFVITIWGENLTLYFSWFGGSKFTSYNHNGIGYLKESTGYMSLGDH